MNKKTVNNPVKNTYIFCPNLNVLETSASNQQMG